jgi:hypothetical protein
MLAIDTAPTLHPARVKGTQGAGAFLPAGVSKLKVESALGVLGSTTSVQ